MPTLESSLKNGSVDELRQRVAQGQYAVDAERIADSLISKIRLIRLGRRQLEGARTRRRFAPPR
jgi:hypothetical protein